MASDLPKNTLLEALMEREKIGLKAKLDQARTVFDELELGSEPDVCRTPLCAVCGPLGQGVTWRPVATQIAQDSSGRVRFECDSPSHFGSRHTFPIKMLPDHLLADFARLVQSGERNISPLSDLNHLLSAPGEKTCSAQLGRDSIRCPRKAVFVEQTRSGMVILFCADHVSTIGDKRFPISQVGSEYWPRLNEMIIKGEPVRFDVIKELRP